MRPVIVVSVTKDLDSNSEVVVAEGNGTGWGTIKTVTFVAPAGKHRIGQRVEVQTIEGTTGY
jgi:hypothetical protein